MKDWYLIGSNTKPNMIGGYENQGFLDCKDDAFAETLETDIAKTVLLYNHDLSESKEIRAIIQGNTSGTYLTSMERAILVTIGTLHSGDYIFFEDEYWIVDGRPGNNEIYEKATLKECQYKLRWQKNDGTIIERWSNLTSASKYDVGKNGNNTIILSSNNYTVIIPFDDDGMTIDGKRVFIDASKIPEKVFEITRNDDVLYLHGSHGGTLSLIANKAEINLETDNQELRLCNYIPPSTPTPPQPSNPDETADLFGTISGSNNLKVNIPMTYTATIYGSDGNESSWDDTINAWRIISDFEVKTEMNGNKITITVEEDYIDSSFILRAVKSSNESILAEITIDVIGLY